ncbi:hypothetical protein [Hymenobacter weizhouensis]|uniref:hypothetical protein n=1 Tax=Hymenobacter sp. YIM 151500-1 TaxID=2987689 RepID=UPI00222679AC|nr:hypothetical protein [Hymenobacter sp. YIM 151500-1]UYZ64291.1 hypothetical protein OIS53_05435 [Hymenobacter sp. YIM 151500-1]
MKSILLITNEPLCPTCQQAVRRFLQPFGLEARLRLQARQAAPATCGCRHSGAASPTPTVLDELLSAEVAAEFEAEILTEEQKKALQRIVVAEAEQLRQNLYGTKSKPGRSGDPVKAQVNRNVGAGLVRLANDINSRPDLLAQAARHSISAQSVAEALKAHGKRLIGKAKQSRHKEIEVF